MFGPLERFGQGSDSSGLELADTIIADVFTQLQLEVDSIAETNPQVRVLNFFNLTAVSRPTRGVSTIGI